jgi:hypothetical protein
MCRQTLAGEARGERSSLYLAILIGRAKSTHCYAFCDFSAHQPFPSHCTDREQRSRQTRARSAFSRRGPCVPSRSALGRRMLFIRFVNRAVQAVWRSHHEGRKQARDSGHSPFRDPTGGRSPRARGSRSVAPLLQAATKLSSNPMAAAPRVAAPVSISIVVLPWRRNRS